MATAVECLVEIFSFLDRRRLETALRPVSRKFGVILNQNFATLPYHVLDSIEVDLLCERFDINDVNYYGRFVRVEHEESAQVVFDAQARPIFDAARRCKRRRFERVGGGGGVPRYLRVLDAHFYLRSRAKDDHADQEDFLRDVVAAFASTWADFAPGHVAFSYERWGLNVVDALLKLTSVPALTLLSFDEEPLGTGFRSLFDHPSVRECARLALFHGFNEGAHRLDALPSDGGLVGWLHSAPRMRSSHRLREYERDVAEGVARVRVAHAARRELQIYRVNLAVDFDYLQPLIETIANAFIADTIRRDYTLDFNFLQIFPNDPFPADSQLVNERTRECLRLEWRKVGAEGERDALRVTRAPLPPAAAAAAK